MPDLDAMAQTLDEVPLCAVEACQAPVAVEGARCASCVRLGALDLVGPGGREIGPDGRLRPC